MNELEFFLSLEHHNRQTGRTTALAKACKDIDGIFIVHSESMRNDMKHKIPGLKVEIMSNIKALVGNNSPIIFDHLVMEQILTNYQYEGKQLRAENIDLKRKLLKIKHIMNELEA